MNRFMKPWRTCNRHQILSWLVQMLFVSATCDDLRGHVTSLLVFWRMKKKARKAQILFYIPSRNTLAKCPNFLSSSSGCCVWPWVVFVWHGGCLFVLLVCSRALALTPSAAFLLVIIRSISQRWLWRTQLFTRSTQINLLTVLMTLVMVWCGCHNDFDLVIQAENESSGWV